MVVLALTFQFAVYYDTREHVTLHAVQSATVGPVVFWGLSDVHFDPETVGWFHEYRATVPLGPVRVQAEGNESPAPNDALARVGLVAPLEVWGGTLDLRAFPFDTDGNHHLSVEYVRWRPTWHIIGWLDRDIGPDRWVAELELRYRWLLIEGRWNQYLDRPTGIGIGVQVR